MRSRSPARSPTWPGWTPLSTPTSTLWVSPSGQVVEVPWHATPPPGVDAAEDAVLPDPDELAALDRHQLEVADEPPRPWLPAAERAMTDQRVWLDDDAPF